MADPKNIPPLDINKSVDLVNMKIKGPTDEEMARPGYRPGMMDRDHYENYLKRMAQANKPTDSKK